MATTPSAESGKVRAQVLEIMQGATAGMTPAEIYLAIYGKPADLDNDKDKAAKQRVYYWLKTLANSKHLTQRGTSRGSTYFLNSARPTPEVRDLPKRPYTRRTAAPEATPSTNGTTDNRQLISFIVDDIAEKFERLRRLL